MMTIRVLIVDDSITMRAIIGNTLRVDSDIEVVGEAADPYEARQMIKDKAPDVITLDIEMPNMDGMAFLEKIMRLRPTPVIMVSTLTQAGAEVTLRALEIGAFDCVPKPGPGNQNSLTNLVDKVKAAARAGCRPRLIKMPQHRLVQHNYESDGRLIAIGSSTGGVEALIEILSRFPINCPPIIVSQHMPPIFTKSFSARLDKLCPAHVQEAKTGQRLEVGNIYIAPGDWHFELSGRNFCSVRLNQSEKVNGHRPSVDVMFHSVAKRVGAKAIGVILTGLGADGARGLLALRRAGALTIGQDEASCVVYGMPKAAFEIGAVARQYPLDRIAGAIISLTNVKNIIRTS